MQHLDPAGLALQAWHSSISAQLQKAVASGPKTAEGQSASIELAVESCLAAAVRRRVTDTLWRQHAAADRLLLNTARGLADGSGKFLPRSSSMAEANMLVRHCGPSDLSACTTCPAAGAAIACQPMGIAFCVDGRPATYSYCFMSTGRDIVSSAGRQATV